VADYVGYTGFFADLDGYELRSRERKILILIDYSLSVGAGKRKSVSESLLLSMKVVSRDVSTIDPSV